MDSLHSENLSVDYYHERETEKMDDNKIFNNKCLIIFSGDFYIRVIYWLDHVLHLIEHFLSHPSGCEFGDRDPALCRFAPVGDCEVELKENCCQTCAQTTPRPSTLNRAPYHMVYSTASQWPPPVTPSLIGWMHVLAWVAYLVDCWPVTRYSWISAQDQSPWLN